MGKSSVSRVLADYLGVIYEEAAARFERAQFSLYPTLSSAEDAGAWLRVATLATLPDMLPEFSAP